MGDIRELSAYDYFIAYSVWQRDSWKEIVTTDFFEEEQEQVYIENNSPSPENTYLRKETFDSLSEDAKEIILTILDDSIDLLELYSAKEKRTNRNKIAKYFRKKWGARNRVKEAIEKISRFVDDFDRLPYYR